MTIRHTVDTITSDALDQLYERAERAELDIASEHQREDRRRKRLAEALHAHPDSEWPKLIEDARCAHELAEKRALLVAQLAAGLAATYDLTIDEVLTEARTAIAERTTP